ncbi:unnamed protein product [Miscanthus lutarioriparius]|uniref:Uncharacterized protein n=1 Tax=Miscanthus lutarioriparius TaxID=422564 RepID=A0A811R5H9_9POAL|nr:unnamed protein product [Miscanthus lutarioriparius]
MAPRALLSSHLAGLYGQEAVNCGRRAFSAAAAAVRKEPVEAAGKARPAAAADKTAAAAKMEDEESFWIRDPKTGCWMPENHLRDVDAADLRARLLFSKKD